MAQESLHLYADSPEPLLLTHVICPEKLCAVPNTVFTLNFFMPSLISTYNSTRAISFHCLIMSNKSGGGSSLYFSLYSCGILVPHKPFLLFDKIWININILSNKIET